MYASLKKPRVMKRCCAALLVAALFFTHTAAASSATPPVSPAATPAPTPVIWPNVRFVTDGVIKEGAEGDAIVWLQERLFDLGWYNFKVTGFFGASTKEAVREFQRAAALTPDGEAGPVTLELLNSNLAPRGYGLRGQPPTPTPTPKKTTRVGKIVEWSAAQKFVAKRGGSSFRVIDYRTGREYRMVRTGGTNHMDVEPPTKKDNDIFKSTYGGRWSWDRRPILVRFGSTWYAASINGMPHGGEDEWYRIRNNGMNGQVCIHFKNSRTHERNAIDTQHQRCINEAAGKR